MPVADLARRASQIEITLLGELGYRFFTSREKLMWYLEELLGTEIDGDTHIGDPIAAAE